MGKSPELSKTNNPESCYPWENMANHWNCINFILGIHCFAIVFGPFLTGAGLVLLGGALRASGRLSDPTARLGETGGGESPGMFIPKTGTKMGESGGISKNEV